METLKERPVFVFGAGSGLGFALARRLALEGNQIFAGTRSGGHFEELVRAVARAGGIEPGPFIADITKPEEVSQAYDSLHLQEHEKVHYFPVAAGGLETVMKEIVREVFGLVRASRTETGITTADLEGATASIKALTTTSEAMDSAMKINYAAPLAFFDLLVEGDHLDSDSIVLNTSSSISHECDPDHPESYPGPWFYYSVGMSKERGVRALREKVAAIGGTHIDIVAPEISDTRVGKFINQIAEVMQPKGAKEEIVIPAVTSIQVADFIIRELSKSGRGIARARTVYVESSGAGYEKPASWDKSFFPYL